MWRERTGFSPGSPTKWNWSFGDITWFNTTVSTLKSPAHIYSSAGTHITILIACNAAGCNTTGLTKTITVTSFSPPVIKFVTNVSSGNSPLAVNFTDISTRNPTKWNWSFGDGTWFNTTIATQKSPTHIYTMAGTYIAKLIACNAAGCNITGPTKTITVSTLAKPIVKFTTNRTTGKRPTRKLRGPLWKGQSGSQCRMLR